MAKLSCEDCGEAKPIMLWVGSVNDGFYSCSSCYRLAIQKFPPKKLPPPGKQQPKRQQADDDDPLLK